MHIFCNLSFKWSDCYLQMVFFSENESEKHLHYNVIFYQPLKSIIPTIEFPGALENNCPIKVVFDYLL